MLFNVPLAVWILEGFMSAIPRAIDETAVIDGFSFPRFFVRVFLPLIRSAVGVTAFFCFMFSWVELLLARPLTSVDAKPLAAPMTRPAHPACPDSRRGRLTKVAVRPSAMWLEMLTSLCAATLAGRPECWVRLCSSAVPVPRRRMVRCSTRAARSRCLHG
jgi:hypothetical protein